MTDVLNLHKNFEKGRVEKEVNAYYSLFDNNMEQATASNEEKRRVNHYALVDNFYDLVTDFYEYGWSESFHFGPRHRGETFQQSLVRYELYCALRLGLKPGMKVLDVGCGVGGPMRNIARFCGSNITGLNINEYQMARGSQHNKRDGLDATCDFMKGDFMNIPVNDDTYDGIYEIEATCHAPNKEGVYGEIFRVLKPGAMFCGYEWVTTEKYDSKNAEHNKIKYGIELGNGLPPMATKEEVQEALRKVGFEIIELTDFGVPTEQNPIPWYDPLNGRMTLTGFRFTRVGRWLTAKTVGSLERVGVAPKGSLDTALMLNSTADELVRGGQTGIFSPSYFFLVRKPLNAKNPPKPTKSYAEQAHENKKEK